MNIGDMGVPFIYQGEELIYPDPVKDGLVLWYDFSGMTNDDESKGIAKDLSGNGNHGTLQNFNFTSESGYDKNKLLFDGVDDYVSAVNPLSNQTPENQNWSVEIVVKKQRSISESSNLISGVNFGLRYAWSDALQSYRMLNYTNLSHGIYLYSPYAVYDEIIHHFVFNYSSEIKTTRNFIDGNYTEKKHPDDLIPTGMNENISINLNGGIVYSTRIYNRALSPEEVTHNYTVEKERFGIE